MNVRSVPGTALTNDATGEVVYTPPEGEARMRDLLANWERFLHEAETIDPLSAWRRRTTSSRPSIRSPTATGEPGACSTACS